MKTVRTKVTSKAYELLKKRAEEQNLSVAALVRNLIYNYIGIEGGQKVDLSPTYATREELEEIKKRLEALEKEIRRMQGIGFFMSRKK